MAILTLADAAHSGLHAIATSAQDFSRIGGNVEDRTILQGFSSGSQTYDPDYSSSSFFIPDTGSVEDKWVEFETSAQAEVWLSFTLAWWYGVALSSSSLVYPFIRWFQSSGNAEASDGWAAEVSSFTQQTMVAKIRASDSSESSSAAVQVFGETPVTPRRIDARLAYSNGNATVQLYLNRVLQIDFSLPTTNFSNVNRVRIYNVFAGISGSDLPLHLSEVTYEDSSTLGRRVFSKSFLNAPTNQWQNALENITDVDDSSFIFATADEQEIILDTPNLPALGSYQVDPYLIRTRAFRSASPVGTRLERKMQNGSDEQSDVVVLSEAIQGSELLIDSTPLVSESAFNAGQVTLTSKPPA